MHITKASIKVSPTSAAFHIALSHHSCDVTTSAVDKAAFVRVSHLVCLFRWGVLVEYLLAGGGFRVQGDPIQAHVQYVLYQGLVCPGVLHCLHQP